MFNAGNRIINTWLYPIQDGFVLIDTGYENGFKHFKKRISKFNIKIKDIRYIFLTHAHDDHVGFLNQILDESPNTKIVMHDKALEILYKGQNSFIGGCTSRTAFLFCQIMKLFGKGEHSFSPLKQEFEKRCILVSDKNRKEIEKELNGKIIDTPGHTDDSISLLIDDGVLFCGDSAMNGFPSTHKITIFAESKLEFIQSWKTIINTKPKMIYPGHGKPFEYSKLEQNLIYVNKINLYPLHNSKDIHRFL
ncbi:MBL fold metallo-hydrolase [Clostridioides difficile]|uniref:Beta-lactamase-like hydrolase n=4 Tax=Clostridioides difficile TaxID=1496 RepID=Q188X3_CLOD6|nr:MBL fold metallo-hydrolase [Clostridioides difficile]AJP10204.1 putative beta-lactamase-like hydrolase [Clostridioides difficile 630]AQU10995.1 MBL fold metallo-hydrolase [Clostridioides difficile]ARE61430.1 putative beta-lactamase-like hydrolase [Clostridioides difficile]ASN88305.1 MBL fold metallo-hydrolase [Clostridioides difficile]AUA24346.1 MBL fold metallo-hydrolase [Clostridioides difficile]